jgi:hypothetical protein
LLLRLHADKTNIPQASADYLALQAAWEEWTTWEREHEPALYIRDPHGARIGRVCAGGTHTGPGIVVFVHTGPHTGPGIVVFVHTGPTRGPELSRIWRIRDSPPAVGGLGGPL